MCSLIAIIIICSILILAFIYCVVVFIYHSIKDNNYENELIIKNNKIYEKLINSNIYELIYYKRREEINSYIYIKYKNKFLYIKSYNDYFYFDYIEDISSSSYNWTYLGYKCSSGIKVNNEEMAKKMILLHYFWVQNNNGNDYFNKK